MSPQKIWKSGQAGKFPLCLAQPHDLLELLLLQAACVPGPEIQHQPLWHLHREGRRWQGDIPVPRSDGGNLQPLRQFLQEL